MNEQLFPVDFSILNKGDVFTQIQIERIYNVRYSTNPNDYHFRAMSLMQDIEQERPDLLVRIDGLSVRVMTDVEADDITDKRIAQAVRSIGRNAKRRSVINREHFSNDERRVSEVRDRNATALMLMTSKQLRASQREKLMLSSAAASEPEQEVSGK